MIGRLPHPLDASKTVYVSLLYRESSGDWRPLHGQYHATERDAFLACTEELTRRAEALSSGNDELRVNLERLFDAAGTQDIIHVGRVLHRFDIQTSLLVPVDEEAPPERAQPEAEVLLEEVMESLTRARRRTRVPVSAERLRRVSALLGKMAVEWERSASPGPGAEAVEDPGKPA